MKMTILFCLLMTACASTKAEQKPVASPQVTEQKTAPEAKKPEEKVSVVQVDLKKKDFEISQGAGVLANVTVGKKNALITIQADPKATKPERTLISLGEITSLKFLKKDKPVIVTMTAYEKSKKIAALERNVDYAVLDGKFLNLNDFIAPGRMLTVKVTQ